MPRQASETLPDLYETDETAWLDAMAELIRGGQTGELDFFHLAEYLDDMAKRDRREVNSRLRILLMHAMKWSYQKEMRTPSWRSTVLEQQAELEDDLEGGVLRQHAEQALPAIYGKAVKQAIQETQLPTATFPAECPWTLDEIMSAEVLEP